MISQRLFQKDCAQFHPCPPVHFNILSTKTRKKRFESHFILKIPDLRGQKFPVWGNINHPFAVFPYHRIAASPSPRLAVLPFPWFPVFLPLFFGDSLVTDYWFLYPNSSAV
jgi:hypothetical protein